MTQPPQELEPPGTSDLPLGQPTWPSIQGYIDQRLEVVNPPRLTPGDPEEVADGSDLDKVDLETPTPAGPAKIKLLFDPEDPIGRALAALPSAAVGVGWMLAAGWVFGRAIDVPDALAAGIALVPALGFVLAVPAQLVRRSHREKKAAADKAAPATNQSSG